MEDNRVFFPLRSNIGSFQSLDLQEEMASNIKQSILVYDEVYIEDGTLTASVIDNGNFVSYEPPDKLPSDQRTIEYERDLKPSSMSFKVKSPEGKWLDLMGGNSIAKFKVDYYKIFEGIERSDYDFLKFAVLEHQILGNLMMQSRNRLKKIRQSSKTYNYPNISEI